MLRHDYGIPRRRGSAIRAETSPQTIVLCSRLSYDYFSLVLDILFLIDFPVIVRYTLIPRYVLIYFPKLFRVAHARYSATGRSQHKQCDKPCFSHSERETWVIEVKVSVVSPADKPIADSIAHMSPPDSQ